MKLQQKIRYRAPKDPIQGRVISFAINLYLGE